MPTRRRSGAAARLLQAVFCVTAGCAAAQQQQPSAVVSTPDEMWCVLEQTVWSGLQPLVSKLQSRVDALESRLGQVEGEGGPGGSEPLPRDCSDLPAGTQSGINLLQPGLNGPLPPVPAYCELDTHGGHWTVFQRRKDIQPHQDFYLGWAAYREGFGELDAEFWWGLENLWRMTSAQDQQYQLRIDMEDFKGEKRHALYQDFRISSEEDGYRLSASSYTGDAGDSLSYQVNSKFSTRDRDQDGHPRVNCAQEYKGAWWYRNCGYSSLNGRYPDGPVNSVEGMWWRKWRQLLYYLKETEMKIRRI